MTYLELASWVFRFVAAVVVCVAVPLAVALFLGDVWDMWVNRVCVTCGRRHGISHRAAHRLDHAELGPDLERIP